MANNITRMPRGVPMARPQQQAAPSQQWWGPGWGDGGWWDGGCDDAIPPFPCPGPGWPPPGCPPWWSGANSPPWYPGANAGVSFGTTAPLNPVRGHFWWDGKVLWMFDGAAWVNTAAGPAAEFGVTDGSNVSAGQVGEVITGSATGTFTTAQAQQTNVSPITYPAGDWDTEAACFFYPTNATTGIMGVYFGMNTIPAGFGTGMTAVFGNVPAGMGTATESIQLQSPITRALLATPITPTWGLITNVYGVGNSGNFSFWVRARRMR